MDSKEKSVAKRKLGLALQKIIEENKNKIGPNSITSLRKLAASSGIEYAIIQKISSGQKDPQFTTLVSLADGLDMNITEFLFYFEKATDHTALRQNVAKNKKKKS